MTGQRRRLWVNNETASCLRKVPSHRLVLGQRRTRLTGIEPAMGCNAGPTLNRNLVGRSMHPLYEIHRRQVLNEYWPAPAMVVEGIHAEDIFELVSLVLSLIISRTFRILPHAQDQYTDFLSIALRQTKE